MLITDPGMTALWEQALDEVAEGRLTLNDFLQRQVGWTRNLVSMGGQQRVSIRIPPTPSCPLCGGKTRLKKGQKGEFWGCTRYPDCKGIINNDTQKRKSARSSKAVKPKNN